MKDNPYISQRTRDVAMRAIDDLPTDVLLDAMRQLPLSSFRKKELEEAYSKDVSEHRKVFRMEEKSPKEAEPIDPGRLMAAMSYANAPQGPSGGDAAGLKMRSRSAAPEQGDPLGAYKVAKPEVPDSQAPIYNGFKIDGSAGDGTSQSEVG